MDTASECKQCRQPLEEWEDGFCEGCGMKLITGRTVRQEILVTAALRMKLFNWTALQAILSCIDAWQSKPEGSICHSMGLYVDAMTDGQFKRLESDIRSKASAEFGS